MDKSKLTGVTGSKIASTLSDVAWKAFQSVNKRLPEGEAIRPKWAPGPLLKSYERSAPPLGFPRETDSLCPRCVKEVRTAVIDGTTSLESLMNEHPGEIKAQIVEEKRQVIILFSGGEPTISPYYLDAVAYAKKIGFYRILAATNGIRFAEDIEFCKAAKAAGQHGVYLQFDGVGEEKNKHRGVGNLFDVKVRAIENLASVGIKVTLVVTIVNSINNDAIGQIVEFAAKNIDKVQTIAFQPVSFTGRDEDISDELRTKWRYTLAGMTHDLKDQLGGRMQPLRDWYPLSSYSAFTSVMDMLQGADAPWGWSSCNCHPNCGIFTLAVVNKKTGDFRSLFEFFNYEQFMKDVAVITDTARGKKLSYAQLGMAIMRNYNAAKAPEGFPISQIVNLFKPSSTNSNSDRNDRMTSAGQDTTSDNWRVLCVEGMWFQDLFNYDFRRTEMCVIPYGTQEGEISFCAYNTGVGWRQIIENMHKTANLADWYEEHGRHAVYAAGHNVPGIARKHSLSLPIIQAVLAEDADEKPVVVSPYLVEEREEQSVTV